MNALFYFMCGRAVLRAYADACESGAAFCACMSPDNCIKSELDE